MADAIGLGIGITSFIFQVASGIEKLHSTIKYNRTQVPENLASLSARLEILQGFLNTLRISQDDPIASLILTECQHTYKRLDAQLNKVLERFSPKSSLGRKHLRSTVGKNLADNRVNIEALKTEVSRIIELVML